MVPSFVPLANGVPSNVHCDFANANYWILNDGVYPDPAQFVSVLRASFGATDLLPTSAAGASFNTFANNVLRITPTKGLLVEVARTNQLLNSTAPVTQTTASLATGSYVAWMNGSGSMAVSAGTATLTGAGTATNGTPNTFTVTVAGTVTVTMSGQVLACQLEAATQGATGTSLIVTGAATVTRIVDAITLIGTPLSLMGGTDVSLFFKDGGGAAGSGGQRLSGNVDTAWLAANAGNSIRSVTTGFSLSAVIGGGGSIALPCRSGLAWNASGRSLVVNNGTLVTDAHDVAANTTWSLGQAAAAGTALNGYVQSFDLWASRLADAGLKGLTV